METSREKFKPVALKNCELENRKTDINGTLLHFRFIKDFNRKNKIKDYSIQESSNSIKPSIQTLMEEFKAVVLEKHELEYRVMSIIIALLGMLIPMWETIFLYCQ